MLKLMITLCSDLCTAGADGFGSVIDTDIVTDRDGFPVIPARRLKGCLREAAEQIGAPQINAIFGVSGDRKSGSLMLGNAVLPQRDTVLREASRRGLTARQITELFTQVRAETAVGEDGSAEENTLRFTRVICREQPWDPEAALEFCAPVTIGEEYVPTLGRICMALRHIGLKRTRGLGAVQCRLVSESDPAVQPLTAASKGSTACTLHYAIRLNDPLMLPGSAGDETADFIPGQAVLGALAGKWLQTHEADAEFDRLFLSGAVRFSNLYVTDDSLAQTVPAPGILGKSKDQRYAGKLLNLLSLPENTLAKPVKGGYLTPDGRIISPTTERIYHNALHHDPAQEGGLYTQTALNSHQYFRGTLTGSGADLQVLADLLQQGGLRFGRSKTAQYASCTLVALQLEEDAPETVTPDAEGLLAFTAQSDIMLLDENGSYAATAAALCKALGQQPESLLPASLLKYRTVSGFSSVIGLQRAHCRVIAAGSTLVAKVPAGDYPVLRFIGEAQNEGFGAVRCFPAAQYRFGRECSLTLADRCAADIPEITAFLERYQHLDEKRLIAVRFAQEREKRFKTETWNAAFIGRLTLMTKEAADADDLQKRFNSIKSESKRTAANQLLKEIGEKAGWQELQSFLLTVLTAAKYIRKRDDKGKVNPE